MPKDKYAGSDPDPTQFLFVSPEQKRADQVQRHLAAILFSAVPEIF